MANLQSMLLGIKIEQSNGCWYPDLSNPCCRIIDGYTYLILARNIMFRAHRLAAKFWLPNFNSKLLVCHKCDNTPCFNPEHIFQGTHQDNTNDCIAKGRNFAATRQFCKFGHSLTDPNNVYLNKITKKRSCLTCRRIRHGFGKIKIIKHSTDLT